MMELLIACAVGFVIGYMVAIPTHPWVQRKVSRNDNQTRYEQAEREFVAALKELRQKNPRIDLAAGSDHGVGYGLKNGLT